METLKITYENLVDCLKPDFSPEAARQFLSMLSASIDRELVNRAANPTLQQVTDWDSPLQVGLIPIETLVDSVALGTGLPRREVSVHCHQLNCFVSKQLHNTPHAQRENGVELEGFGIFKLINGTMYYLSRTHSFLRTHKYLAPHYAK